MLIVLVVLAVLIVVILGAYAGSLLIKLSRQKQLEQAATEQRLQQQQQRQANILKDIRYIAKAMVEERCELSEGVVRIAKLFESLSMSERVCSDFPNIFQHFNKIKSHPILDARKELSKQQRMKLDLERLRAEEELQSAILTEARRLTTFTAPVSH